MQNTYLMKRTKPIPQRGQFGKNASWERRKRIVVEKKFAV
jgi:hypothetical protein